MPPAGGDFERIHELFSAFGPVNVRRMFGGAGVFAEGVMIALLAGDVLYLKADAASAAAFEREGCGPFSYETKDGRRTVMAYWRAPERLYDDPEELAEWARTALAVARRADTKKGCAAEVRSPRSKPRVRGP